MTALTRPTMTVEPGGAGRRPDATWQLVPHDARVIVFPWDCITHDNHRFTPAANRRGLVASREYRAKKLLAVGVAMLQWAKMPLLDGDVSLTARCYFPDKRKRDAGNYRKLITDALSGIAYADDAQLEVETWRRAGIDRERPRIEVLLYSNFGRTPTGAA